MGFFFQKHLIFFAEKGHGIFFLKGTLHAEFTKKGTSGVSKFFITGGTS
jgi:hypothetical protein